MVAGAHWSVTPSHDGASAWFWLKRIVVEPEEFEWEDGFVGYMAYAQKRGWEVFGGYGRLGRKAAQTAT